MIKGEGKVALLQGNEACAEAAIRAGVRFFAGYPITPSTEIAEHLARRLPEVGGKFIQMEDEIASMAAVIGASLAGAKAMTATSGPGFSLKQENLGYAALAEIPCTVVNVQRVGPSTGLPTSPAQGDVMQARWGPHGDHPVVVLCPSSVQEAYHLTVEAVNISERLRIPSILLMDEVIGHMREKMVIPESVSVETRRAPEGDRSDYRPYDASGSDVPPMAAFGQGYHFHVTGLFHGEDGFPIDRGPEAARLLKRVCNKVEKRKQELVLTGGEALEDCEVAVFAYGSPVRVSLRAVRLAREQGIRAGLLTASILWPFPDEKVRELAERVKTILVPEMNLGQMVREVERSAGGRCRVNGVSRVDGELFTPAEILEALRGAAT